MLRKTLNERKINAALTRRVLFLSAIFLGGCALFGYFLIPVSNAQADFSRFKHSNPTHGRLPCLVCHVRSDNSATVKYMGHIPCASCHKQQFDEGNKSPICSICHTPTGVKRFPGLQTFTARFDHAQHQPQANCASCHKVNRRGAGFSIPSGAGAHNSCFQCHSSSASNAMASCSTCHQPGSPQKTSDWAKAYSTTFTHSKHLQTMNCASCHTVKAGAGRGRQVTAPLTSMHFAPKNAPSCGACHNNRRAFGGEDFNDCKRCHRGTSFKF
ncbi:MAG TPA: cytochrome c3 family protein [Pyrinomonadaceae bacterium]|jgi:c(7)-type cytochrome triheme protein